MKKVVVIVDRPIGYIDDYKNKYLINYGYVPNIFADDGEEQDAYILGVDYPISRYEGFLIAIIKRKDDVEDKWVVSDKLYSKDEIWEKVCFIEKYFDSEIILLK